MIVISDFDECGENTDGCQHICTNYDGGYNCSCYLGYSLDANLRDCSGIMMTVLTL